MDKKQYIAPEVKCVEVKVEVGYAMSQGMRLLDDWNQRPDNPPTDPSNPFAVKFGGFYYNNNDDWD